MKNLTKNKHFQCLKEFCGFKSVYICDDEDSSEDENSNDEIDEVDQESSIIDKSLAGQNLPKAGIKSTIITISIILLIGAVFFIIRYRQLDDFIK
ncbi:MAG: LPXTG cell wall anchor domain-containing protein [Clostridia bacterium]